MSVPSDTPFALPLRACLVVAFGACASINRPSQSNAPVRKTVDVGEIAGMVYDSLSGRPLQNAQLFLRRAQVDRPTLSADTTVVAVISDSLGRFAITGIQPGQYILLVRWIGYRTQLIPANMGNESGLELRILLSPVPCPERILNCLRAA